MYDIISTTMEYIKENQTNFLGFIEQRNRNHRTVLALK